MKGQAEAAVSDMVPNGPYADKSLRPRPYDPVRARKMLLDDGFAPGPGGFLYKGGRRLDVPLWTLSGRAPLSQAMQLIAQSWRSIGGSPGAPAGSAPAAFGPNRPQGDGEGGALIFPSGQGGFRGNRS